MNIVNFLKGRSQIFVFGVIVAVLLTSAVGVVSGGESGESQTTPTFDCQEYCNKMVEESGAETLKINGLPCQDWCKNRMDGCKERFEKEGVKGAKLVGLTDDAFHECKCVDEEGKRAYCFFPYVFWKEEDCPVCSALGIKLHDFMVTTMYSNTDHLCCVHSDKEAYERGKSSNWVSGIEYYLAIDATSTTGDAQKIFKKERDSYLKIPQERGPEILEGKDGDGDRFVYFTHDVNPTHSKVKYSTDWSIRGTILYKEIYVITVGVRYVKDKNDAQQRFYKLEECAKAVIDEKNKKRIFGRAFLDDKTRRYPYGGLRNAKVELKHNGNIYKDYTDDGGFFEFDAEVEMDDQITLTLYLEDEVNGKNYIKIFDKQSTNPSDPVYIEKTCRITDEDLRNGIDFIFDKNSITSGYRSGSSSSVLSGLVKEYIIFEDAVAFALEKLKTDIHNVSIHANNPNAKTECKSHSEENSACYDPTTRQIILGPNYVKLWPNQDSGFLSPYTEFHEFGHHIMFCHKEYLRDISYQVINHGGMMNPTTHDSLCEGEADFMALLMYEYKSYIISRFAEPSSVMGGKNFEVNYKAWLMEGNINREDIAVASLLWDLYDVKNPKHPERLDDKHFPSQNKVYDECNLSLQDMWSILKSSNCINVWNLYIVLTKTYPADKQKIDNLFIAHGFFRDKESGNGSYDGPVMYENVTMEGELERIYFCGEPYHDKNNNGVRDANEPFVDLGHGHKFPGGQVYTANEDVVGTASNYLMFGTPTKVGRQIGPIVKNSYILVKNEETQEFLVKVEFEPEYSYYNYEYMTSSPEGLLYISFPPPEYKTTVTITPISENYVAEKPLKIESEEYFDLISKSTDENHFLEHEFDLQPIKEAYVLGLTFESRSKSSGSTVQIPLTLRGIKEKIGNMDITLSYDPSVLDAKEVIKGSLTTKSLFDYNILDGTIKISLADEEGFSEDGSIAHLKFNVIGAEGSSSPLTIVAIAANKAEDYETLEVPTNDGMFKVISMEESRGDGDGDGGFTALDALYALQMAVGKIPEDLAMDMNGDGSVTSLDAQKILKIAVGEE